MMWPDLEAIKAWLNITGTEDDAWLTHKREVAISMIERYCNRLFELQNRIEEHDLSKCSGVAIGEIILKAVPIVVINDITGVSSWRQTGYGTICLQLGCRSETSDGTIIVDYDGGFDPLPPEILDAFYNMISSGYATKDVVDTGGQIKKETVMGVVSTEYVVDGAAAAGTSDPTLPGYYDAILDSYIIGKV